MLLTDEMICARHKAESEIHSNQNHPSIMKKLKKNRKNLLLYYLQRKEEKKMKRVVWS